VERSLICAQNQQLFENEEIRGRVLTYNSLLKRKKTGLQIEKGPIGTDQTQDYNHLAKLGEP